jgi:hypothetical protein
MKTQHKILISQDQSGTLEQHRWIKESYFKPSISSGGSSSSRTGYTVLMAACIGPTENEEVSYRTFWQLYEKTV